MEENKIGKFIAELRKEKKMTQKDLAARLFITDKAISKWERGLSCPDISLLNSIAEILDVTTSELLNGQRSETISKDIEKTVDNAIVYAQKSQKRKKGSFQNIITIAFSSLLLLGIMVCSICDIAISGGFTWSLYPISSIIFAWFILIPIIKYGSKGMVASLIAISILIIPFLSVISKIIGSNPLIIPIGFRISLFAILYVWCVYFTFKGLKARKLAAAAFSLLLAIPLNIVIDIILSKYVSEELFSIWDICSFVIVIISAAVLFFIDYVRKREKK